MNGLATMESRSTIVMTHKERASKAANERAARLQKLLAAEQLLKAAKAGDANAQFELGLQASGTSPPEGSSALQVAIRRSHDPETHRPDQWAAFDWFHQV